MATQRYFHLHLVSDATGETLISGRARRGGAVQAQPCDRAHPLAGAHAGARRASARARSSSRRGSCSTRWSTDACDDPGEGCRKLGVPCVSILDPVLAAFQSYLGTRSDGRVGAQHVLDAEYFRRIDALNFSLAHDDGQHVETIDEADVVLVGVSRTSKTPTAIYLANRGIKTANLPLVPGAPLPPQLLERQEAAGRRAGREPRPHRADAPAPRARDEVATSSPIPTSIATGSPRRSPGAESSAPGRAGRSSTSPAARSRRRRQR